MKLKSKKHVYDIWDFVEYVKKEIKITEENILEFVRRHHSNDNNGTFYSIPKLSVAIKEDYDMSEVERSIYKLIENKLKLSKKEEEIIILDWW